MLRDTNCCFDLQPPLFFGVSGLVDNQLLVCLKKLILSWTEVRGGLFWVLQWIFFTYFVLSDFGFNGYGVNAYLVMVTIAIPTA